MATEAVAEKSAYDFAMGNLDIAAGSAGSHPFFPREHGLEDRPSLWGPAALIVACLFPAAFVLVGGSRAAAIQRSAPGHPGLGAATAPPFADK